MAIPAGYEKLAVIGIAYRGNYSEGTAYGKLNAVYYMGSTFVALKDSPMGPPAADGANWQYLAQGFMEGVMEAITVTDTYGMLGEANSTVNAQNFMDAIADMVVNKLLAKSQIVNNLLATEPGNILDAMQGKALADMIDGINSNLAAITKTTKVNVTRGAKFSSGDVFCYTRNKICFVTIEITLSSAVANGDVVLNGLPKPASSVAYLALQLTNGSCYSAKLDANGLVIYYPTYTTASRIDTTFCYITA